MNSCPRMSPFSIVGMKPLYRCRSDPQIAVEVIFTIASRLLMILGSGTSNTRTSCLPYQQLAFITCSSEKPGYAGALACFASANSFLQDQAGEGACFASANSFLQDQAGEGACFASANS